MWESATFLLVVKILNFLQSIKEALTLTIFSLPVRTQNPKKTPILPLLLSGPADTPPTNDGQTYCRRRRAAAVVVLAVLPLLLLVL